MACHPTAGRLGVTKQCDAGNPAQVSSSGLSYSDCSVLSIVAGDIGDETTRKTSRSAKGDGSLRHEVLSDYPSDNIRLRDFLHLNGKLPHVN